MKQTEPSPKKRAAPRYWTDINGKLYARLQYKTESGKYKVKYKAITDKRTARTVVDEMRRELDLHGEEIFLAAKMTFKHLLEKYEEVELVEAVYQDGVKVKGRRSVNSIRSAIKPLRAYFGKKLISSIKPEDLRSYKNERLNTPVQIEINTRIDGFNERQDGKKASP